MTIEERLDALEKRIDMIEKVIFGKYEITDVETLSD